jgi:hypothetical protein
MARTRHEAVINALSHRAGNLYVNALAVLGQHAWAIDETGMLETTRLDICNESGIVDQEIKEINAIVVPEDLLQIHGYAPPKKSKGAVRLVYKNVNGLDNGLCCNQKIERSKEIHNELKVDVAAYCKHKLNMRQKKNGNGFNGEMAVQSIVAHNVHENVGKVQQGGTSLILFGQLTEQFDHNKSGKDPTGLGWWTVMTLKGEGIQTRIVCGYNPCGNTKLNSRTSYQQQRRYFVTQKNDLTCPRKRFHDNLIEQITKWRGKGDQIIVCMDANKHIYKKSIGCSLTNQEGLNMQEVVGEFTGKKLWPTFFRGTKPIDGVWATDDLVVTHACVMPVGYGVDDHQMFVVNFQAASLVREAPFRVKQFSSRRLNTKVSSGTTKNYLAQLKENLSQHKLIKKLGNPHICY